MTTRSPADAVDLLANALAKNGLDGVRIALVLGSGLSSVAERLERARAIEYASLPELPRSQVAGHAGRLVVGEIGGERVVVQQGRVHLYEGRSAHEVTCFVRAIVALGCRITVLTNAAGGLHRDWPVGSLMRIADHINLQGETPLHSRERGYGAPYDAELGRELDAAAKDAKVPLYAGVYAGLRGPSYETPAEICDLRRIGASAVGMSTVGEALAAHAAGARVVGLSCIGNHAAGISDRRLTHAEVLDVGRRTSRSLGDVLSHAVPRWVSALRG
jgi:purine-nucleoside phosphorylase